MLSQKNNKILAKAFVAKFTSSLGQLLLFLIVARLYNTKVTGELAIGISLILGISILSRYGSNLSIMKLVGRNGANTETLRILNNLLVKIFIISCIISTFSYLTIVNLDTFIQFEDKKLFLWLFISIPPFTLSYVLAGYFKGAKQPVNAILQENGFISLLSIILLVLFTLILTEVKPYHIGIATCISAWSILFIGLIKLKNINHKKTTNKSNIRQFHQESRNFFLISLTDFAQSGLVILIAAGALSKEDIGILKIVERLSVTISFTLTIVNSIYPPKFSNAFAKNKLNLLKKYYHQTILISGVTALPILITIIIFSQNILSLFNKEYSQHYVVLIILAISQYINVLTGSSQLILNMTNHERTVKNIMMIFLSLQLTTIYYMSHNYGLTGTVLNIAIFLSAINLTFFYYTRKVITK